ncbi:MAG: hypothetical protein Q7U39_06655 [Nitrospira sp.]|nr:hypothetical protein [Nitrospira sp.]
MNPNNGMRPTHQRPLSWLRLLGLAVLALVAPYSGVDIAGAKKPHLPGVGYVEQLVGPISEIHLERDGAPVALALLLPLQTGDRVTVNGAGNELHMRLGTRPQVITAATSPFQIPEIEVPPGFLTRLGSTLVAVGKRLTTQYVHSSVPVSTSSRGKDAPLAMTLVEDGVSRISPNRADLFIAWDGGTAPYVVRIRGKMKGDIARQEVGDHTRARLTLPAGGIQPGTIQIVVQDGKGATTQKTFDVVSPSALPTAPPELTRDDLPSELHAVLIADSLLRSNRRMWKLEAYQLIAPFADAYEPARLFRDCLEIEQTCLSH